jgi:hypothetical protein
MSTIQFISTVSRTNDIRIVRDSSGYIIKASANTLKGKLELRRILNYERLKEGFLYYTLGNPCTYSDALLDPEVKKLGREPGYDGGYVFRTKELAKDFSRMNNLNFIPYGLIIKNPDKDIDWSKEQENGYGSLTADSYIVEV